MRRMFVVLRLRLSSLSRFSTSSLDKFSTSAMDSSICFLCLCPQVDHLFLVTWFPEGAEVGILAEEALNYNHGADDPLQVSSAPYCLPQAWNRWTLSGFVRHASRSGANAPGKRSKAYFRKQLPAAVPVSDQHHPDPDGASTDPSHTRMALQGEKPFWRMLSQFYAPPFSQSHTHSIHCWKCAWAHQDGSPNQRGWRLPDLHDLTASTNQGHD